MRVKVYVLPAEMSTVQTHSAYNVCNDVKLYELFAYASELTLNKLNKCISPKVCKDQKLYGLSVSGDRRANKRKDQSR